ncbi:MAG TPA: hypothetical protein VD886_21565, partial [Herpetosiphonaceae bacterium]|nr:hypothetical protein [Herpetosiphonaceae bacterium]
MTSNPRSLWDRRGCLFAAGVLVLLVVGGIWFYLSIYQGRSIARWTGVPVKVELPECVASVDQVVNISFHKNANGDTIKDVTYKCDGR